MPDPSFTDTAHTFLQVLSATEDGIRAHLSGRGDASISWESQYRKNWRPLYEQLNLKRLDANFDRDDAFDLIDFVVREVDYLNILVDNFLGAARNTQNKPLKKRCDVGGVVLDAVELFRFKAANKGVEIRLDLHDDLSAAVDVRAFRRAIINILDNAVKYSFYGKEGHPRYIDVHARRYSRDGEILLRVSSFGVGVHENERKKVFERGYRSQLARDEHREGIGLGLSEAKAIVEAHNGRINLKSEEQHSGAYITKVTITLRG